MRVGEDVMVRTAVFSRRRAKVIHVTPAASKRTRTHKVRFRDTGGISWVHPSMIAPVTAADLVEGV